MSRGSMARVNPRSPGGPMIDLSRVKYRGLPLDGVWRLPGGRTVPLLAGGAPEEGEEGEAESKGAKGGAAGKSEKEGEGAGEGGDDPAAAARREAADLRKRLRKAEAERDELKAATQSDAEKLAARAEAAEARATGLAEKVRKANLRIAVAEAAPDLGIVDPRLAVRLLDAEKLGWDEESDEPDKDALTAGLRSLAKEYPALTRGGDSDAGRKGGAEGEKDGKARVADFIRGDQEALSG